MAEATKLGKYTLKHKIATGGMAEIWLSEQYGPGGFAKELVLKRILPHLANDHRFVQMFLDEARLAAQLSHPHIVQIFDLGEADGSYFIAMEYVRGYDLEAIVHQSTALGERLAPNAAARIIADACSALDYAHNFRDESGPLKLVHRDISPQNILVSHEGVVKLVDFGVAKAATSTHKTQTGAVKGKFCYMSPEQIRGHPLDRRSDLFAMGIVLYELVTGRRPFGHDSELLAVTAIMNEPPPDPSTFAKDMPPGLERIVLKALQKEPRERYQSAEEMERALETFLSKAGDLVSTKDLSRYLDNLFAGITRETPAPAPTDPLADTALAHTPDPTRPSPQQTAPNLADTPTEIHSGAPAPPQPTERSRAPTAVRPRPVPVPTRRARSASGVLILLLLLACIGVGGYFLHGYVTAPQPSDPSAADAGQGTIAILTDDAGGTQVPLPPDAGQTRIPPLGQPDTGQAQVPAATDAGQAQVPPTVDAGQLTVATTPPPSGSDTGTQTTPASDAGVVAAADTAVATEDTAVSPTQDAGVVASAPDTASAADDPAPLAADTFTVATTEPPVVDAGIVAAGEDTAAEAATQDVEQVAATEDTGRRRRDRGPPDDDEPGSLSVSVSPPGRYEVSVDGRVVGRTPLRRIELEPGRHRVEVRRVGSSESQTRRVRIRPGDNEYVEFEF